MNLNQCYALISEMESSLSDISIVYSEPDKELLEVPIATQIKIKNFLENANSVLDYIAFTIFENYSKKILDEKDFKKKANYVSFFYTKDKERFQKNMDSAFPNLKESNSNIYSVFEFLQPWSAPEWRKILHKLVNQNKHKNLSLQKKTDSFDVINVDIPGSIMIKDSTNITINNMEINGSNYENLSDMKNKLYGRYDYIRIFMFTDLKLPVIDTLTQILDGEKELLLYLSAFELK